MEGGKRNGSAVQGAPEEPEGERQGGEEAVKQNHALQYASEGLKDDRGVVMEAGKQNGRAIQGAPEEPKGDSQVATEAVKQNHAPQYASAGLKAVS